MLVPCSPHGAGLKCRVNAHPWLEPTTKRLGDCFSQHRPRIESRLSLESPDEIDEQTLLLATSATTASPVKGGR